MSQVTEKTQTQELVVSSILSNRLLKYSEDRKISIQAAKQSLAEHLDVKQINITRWCRNNAQPTLAQAIEIAKFLELPVEAVFTTHKI